MMSANMIAAPAAASLAPRHPAFAGLPALLTRLAARRALRRELRRLALTDARLLRDAGIDPEWAAAEIGKPLWQA